MEEGRREKATDEHNVIDDAISDRGEGYTVFSIVRPFILPSTTLVLMFVACRGSVQTIGEEVEKFGNQGLLGKSSE